MILERNEYFNLVRSGKVADVSGEFNNLEERANDLMCNVRKTIKKTMIAVKNATKCDKLVLGDDGNDYFVLTYVHDNLYVLIGNGCNSDDKGETYNIEGINDVERLLSILSWMI